MRLHVMGAPGSGKTTFALSVSEVFGIPVWDLDWIVYDAGTGLERTPNELAKALSPRIAPNG